jgi:hypothetical protein
MAEILLAAEESNNKKLLENAIRQEKRATDCEKRLKELQIYYDRMKEDAKKVEGMLVTKDSQLKQLLGKIKLQEREMLVTTEDLRRKEAVIEQLKKSMQLTTREPEHRTTITGPRLGKGLAEQLSAKDTEIQLMKEMIKNYQVQSRQRSSERYRQGMKLPSLSSSRVSADRLTVKTSKTSKTDLTTFDVQEADFEESYPPPTSAQPFEALPTHGSEVVPGHSREAVKRPGKPVNPRGVKQKFVAPLTQMKPVEDKGRLQTVLKFDEEGGDKYTQARFTNHKTPDLDLGDVSESAVLYDVEGKHKEGEIPTTSEHLSGRSSSLKRFEEMEEASKAEASAEDKADDELDKVRGPLVDDEYSGGFDEEGD